MRFGERLSWLGGFDLTVKSLRASTGLDARAYIGLSIFSSLPWFNRKRSPRHTIS
jgi:hypothetical protein